ncbi:MAG: type I-E CRISPR-associated protein Cas6/Cse3/CasE [Leptonema sp. (in: Bacteria)]|nr:type I-E CRISPR-associated protein Cas6/Cse3/CasE [Leptonema sp. (in: bacteria)]
MYFSRITLQQSKASKYLKMTHYNSLYDEHKLVWRFFEEDPAQQRDFLYRKNEANNLMQFYVLSNRRPVNDQQAFIIETKEFQPIIKKGGQFNFQLRANPVVTRKSEGKASKKRRRDDIYLEALAKNKELPINEQMSTQEILDTVGNDWLNSRSKSLGFKVNYNIIERYHRFQTQKNNRKITFGVIDFNGTLSVEDPQLFQLALFNGIGHAKAFGCGLLLIKRIS